MTEELFQKMSQSILDGDSDVAVALAKQAIEAGIDPLEAITKGFVVGVNQVGESFACGQAFLPELVMAGEAMKAAVATLEPEMQKRGTARQVYGKVYWQQSKATSTRSVKPWSGRCFQPPVSRFTTWGWMCLLQRSSRKSRKWMPTWWA